MAGGRWTGGAKTTLPRGPECVAPVREDSLPLGAYRESSTVVCHIVGPGRKDAYAEPHSGARPCAVY